MAEVEHLAEEEQEAKIGGWGDLKVPWIRRIVVVGIGLAVAQQLTGINSIMYYGTQLLTEAGFSASAALIANIANGVLAVVGSAICLFFLIDRVPRAQADHRRLHRHHDLPRAHRWSPPSCCRRASRGVRDPRAHA